MKGDRKILDLLNDVLTAELTAKSHDDVEEAPLWQETSYDSGDPAVSPDGSKLAMVLRDAEQRGCSVVSPRLVLLEQVVRQVKLLAGKEVPHEALEGVLNALLEDEEVEAFTEQAREQGRGT